VAELSRVGVLIPVPEPHQSRLDGYRAELAGQAPETPAHITLVPPTDVATASLPSVTEHLARVAGASTPFDVVVRGTGTFRPLTPVVYLDVVAGADDCGRLAARTGSGPLTSTPRFPYHPHVTLAHHLADGDLDVAMADWADFEAGWQVAAFRLYQYLAPQWSPLRSYSLGR
jgi:2'-5' RNA ligase